MCKNRFSESTTSILLAAGWYEGRTNSVEETEEVLLDRYGLRLHDAARKFLTEFEGLRLFPLGRGFYRCAFDARSGAREVDHVLARQSTYGQLCLLTKGETYPIGCDFGDMTILMRSDGAVFLLSVTHGWMGFYGRSGDEAVETICSGENRILEIGINDDWTIAEGHEAVRELW